MSICASNHPCRRRVRATGVLALALLLGACRHAGTGTAGGPPDPGIRLAARLDGGQRIVRLALDDRRWRRLPPLVTDHGKLVHLFLIREPELDGFAHVHPVSVGDHRFDVAVPPLPTGTYRVYADLLHEDGVGRRVTGRVVLPPPPSAIAAEPALRPDPDDSWAVAGQVRGDLYKFEDGHFMIWDRNVSLIEGRTLPLRFSLVRPDGKPAVIAPYMGMLSHGAVCRSDASVFGHIHAMSRQAGSSSDADPGIPSGGMMMGHAHAAVDSYPSIGLVALPYEFPKPGEYRIWIQVKSAEKVYTGIFDLRVRAADG